MTAAAAAGADSERGDGDVRLLAMGDRAVLAELDGLADVLALHARLSSTRPDGVVDLVPAARTVLVTVDARVLSIAAARAWIRRCARAASGASAPAGRTGHAVLGIRYDGPDLAETAALLHMSVEWLVAAHRQAVWTVAFTGFAPGFGYLVSPDWPRDVPRLETPRTRVPAGAVGLAAGFTGAYPRATPGGWRLIGTLDPADTAALFDPDAAAPALLAPGTRVRFREGAA